jgi:hypothetical protein
MWPNLCFVAALAAIFAGCAKSEAGVPQAGTAENAGAGGASTGGESSCHGERAALVQLLQTATSCASDSDCSYYVEPCLQTESGNCAGIFYVTASSVEAIDSQKADFEICLGHACGAGGTCALGPTPPTCISGKCR